VLGPATAPISKLKRIYRFHFILRAQKRADLAKALQAMLRFWGESGMSRRGLVVDVDPLSLM
jgi:primosomal protein N' (replication factor Y)